MPPHYKSECQFLTSVYCHRYLCWMKMFCESGHTYKQDNTLQDLQERNSWVIDVNMFSPKIEFV